LRIESNHIVRRFAQLVRRRASGKRAPSATFFAPDDRFMPNLENEEISAMKKDIHPSNYRPVVFMDVSANYSFLTRSTVKTNKTIKWEDGNEYPVVAVDISIASHPFFTGKQKLVDTAGRVDRFRKRYAKSGDKAEG
jgi:large subunit ribosomal protein L31